MTKRLLVLFLVCILAIPILVVPAYAYDTIYEQHMIDYVSMIDYHVGLIYDYIESLLHQIWSELVASNNFLRAISNTVTDIKTALSEYHTELGEWLGTMGADFNGWLEDIYYEINSIYSYLVNAIYDLISNIGLYVEYLYISIPTWIEGQTTSLLDFGTSMKSWWNTYLFGPQGYLYRIHVLLQSFSEREGSEEYENQVATEATEYQENMEIIDEWTRPDYESEFNPEREEITGGQDVSEYTTALGSLFTDDGFTPVLFMSFAFSLISFVVFGKG